MRETWFLFRHFLKADARAQHSIAGLVLFAIATVYAAYQVVQGRPEPETWNVLAWIILLFTAFNGVSQPWKKTDAKCLPTCGPLCNRSTSCWPEPCSTWWS